MVGREGSERTSSNISAREIDEHLRRIATRRAGLDAELGRWLRRADEQHIWNELGYVHALEYLEDVFGYSPRAGRERIRVAKELGQLSALEAALESGDTTYGIVRELTRVAVPANEATWLAAARGLKLRQVERLVAGHAKGDAPDAAPNPDLFNCMVSLELTSAVASPLRETRKHLCDEFGGPLDDAQLVEALCRRALEPANGRSGPTRMIHISVCSRCEQGTQMGGGSRVPITMTEVEMARCDAVFVEDGTNQRATHEIPAATRRAVMERDEHRCRVPGCRATRNLDVHHLRPRCEGGGHEPWNLLVLCSGHHRLLHDGLLSIRGRADGALDFSRGGKRLLEPKPGHLIPRHVPSASASGRASFEQVERDALAKAALQQSGYQARTAGDAVRRAAVLVAPDADLPTLLREAFRLCS